MAPNIREDIRNLEPLSLLNGISGSLIKLSSKIAKQNATVASQKANLAQLNTSVANLKQLS